MSEYIGVDFKNHSHEILSQKDKDSGKYRDYTIFQIVHNMPRKNVRIKHYKGHFCIHCNIMIEAGYQVCSDCKAALIKKLHTEKTARDKAAREHFYNMTDDEAIDYIRKLSEEVDAHR